MSIGRSGIRELSRRGAVIVLFALSCTACGGVARHAGGPHATASGRFRVAGVVFGPAPAIVARECRHTARTLGYAIPCPTALPVGMAPTPGEHGCQLQFIAPAEREHCGGRQWRGWAVGSMQEGDPASRRFQHLALEIAPRAIKSPATVVDWPLRLPNARLTSDGAAIIHREHVALYYVPAASNFGSAQMHHLVMIWTADHHTYAYGFHVVTNLRRARELDLALGRHLRIVRPPKR